MRRCSWGVKKGSIIFSHPTSPTHDPFRETLDKDICFYSLGFSSFYTFAVCALDAYSLTQKTFYSMTVLLGIIVQPNQFLKIFYKPYYFPLNYYLSVFWFCKRHPYYWKYCALVSPCAVHHVWWALTATNRKRVALCRPRSHEEPSSKGSLLLNLKWLCDNLERSWVACFLTVVAPESVITATQSHV